MKILLVEDEPELKNSIVQYLDYAGNIVEAISDFNTASYKIHEFEYECILVDIGIPKGSGLELIKQLKSLKSKAGIIIISAKNF